MSTVAISTHHMSVPIMLTSNKWLVAKVCCLFESKIFHTEANYTRLCALLANGWLVDHLSVFDLLTRTHSFVHVLSHLIINSML